MPKKKKSTAEKELRASLKKLGSRLEKAEAKTANWKQRAKKHQAEKAASQARVAKLEKRLKKAKRAATVIEAEPEPGPTPAAAPASASASPSPDDSWTVAQLRGEARSRGISGYSRKSKAQLLDALG